MAPTGSAEDPAPRFHIGNPGRAFTAVAPLAMPHIPVDGLVIAGDPGPPDTALDGGRLGGWELRAASVRGLAHRYDGRPRQDAYAFCVSTDGEWIVAAVADGVSSGALSHRASALVAHHGCRILAKQLGTVHPDGIDWYAALADVSKAVLALGRRTPDFELLNDEDIARAMSTTVVFAVVKTVPDEDSSAYLCWWGDSSAWSLDPEGRWDCLSEVKNDDPDAVPTNATRALPFLPEDSDDIPARTVGIDAGRTLFLITDGIGDALGNGDGEVGSILSGLWRSPPDLLQFAAHAGFGRQGFDDDRTVLGLWRRDRP
jgi:hypothetical protein